MAEQEEGEDQGDALAIEIRPGGEAGSCETDRTSRDVSGPANQSLHLSLIILFNFLFLKL